MKRDELLAYLDSLLLPGKFKDYCPNGLQVEGGLEVRKIVGGVTASQALLDFAVDRRADAILVHHGYFWKGEDARVVGLRRRRLGTLLANDINLIAYHLPLDAHAEFGNNAQLAVRFGWQVDGRFGDQEVAWLGHLAQSMRLADLATQLHRGLGREPMVIGQADRQIRRMAWCSGGAQAYFEEAIALGVDVFISGEVSEQTFHLANESGVAYIAAGHHATERWGVEALLRHLGEKFGIECEFADLDNPV